MNDQRPQTEIDPELGEIPIIYNDDSDEVKARKKREIDEIIARLKRIAEARQ